MDNKQLAALCNGLIALCQRYDLLPTEGESLADEMQAIASDECYISKNELLEFLEG